MRPFMIVVTSAVWASKLYGQQAPNRPQPPESTQSATTSQGGTGGNVAAPSGHPGGVGTTSDQPASPGTSPLEGAQPGQSGTAQDLERRAIDRRSAPGQFPQQPPDQQRRIDLLNPRPGVDQPIMGQPQFDGGAVDRRDALGRTRTFQGGPRSRAREGERAVIINDLRSRGLAVEDWRVVRHEGRWWLWTPEETWLIYDDEAGDWITFQLGVDERRRFVDRRPVVVYPPGYPRDEWRLVFHNGRWWFWAPNERWLYFDRGRWVALSEQAHALARERQLQREQVGYRGVQQPPPPTDQRRRPNEQPPQPETQTPQLAPAPAGPNENDTDI